MGAPTAAATDCPTCSGSGQVLCCQSAENGIHGGPHGCRCRKRGSRTCWGCDGAGEVHECPECGCSLEEGDDCAACAEKEEA